MNMKKLNLSFILLIIVLILNNACTKSNLDRDSKLVLIYNGPGVSQTESGYLGNAYCWQKVAEGVGYKTILVYPRDSANIVQYFGPNTIWVQPGGLIGDQIDSIPTLMKKNIKLFVAMGGGYVGSCAGAYFAAQHSVARDPTGNYYWEGIGLIPDTVYDNQEDVIFGQYDKFNVYVLTTWVGFDTVGIYNWWGGYMTPKNLLPNSTILSYYPDSTNTKQTNKILAIKTFYQKGPVYLCGSHPEADSSWYKGFVNPPAQPLKYYKKSIQVATSMLEWAMNNNKYSN